MLDEMKIVVRKPPGGIFRFRGAEAAAFYFFGLATYALLVANAVVFFVFVLVAVLAAAWDMGWRVYVRDEPPE
jgi:hypothetical protein